MRLRKRAGASRPTVARQMWPIPTELPTSEEGRISHLHVKAAIVCILTHAINF